MIDHIGLTPSSLLSAVAGKTHQFVAIGYDQYDNAISGVVFTWSTTAGTVDDGGLFTAQTLAGGSGQVEAMNGSVSGVVAVQIVPDQLTHIVISPNPTNVTVKSQALFSAIGYDQYENSISGLTFIWRTNVGRMNGSSLIAQNETGTGFVIASSGNVEGYASVGITPAPFDWLPIILIAGIILVAIAVVSIWWIRKGKG